MAEAYSFRVNAQNEIMQAIHPTTRSIPNTSCYVNEQNPPNNLI
mgnify:CR=1 FL=1